MYRHRRFILGLVFTSQMWQLNHRASSSSKQYSLKERQIFSGLNKRINSHYKEVSTNTPGWLQRQQLIEHPLSNNSIFLKKLLKMRWSCYHSSKLSKAITEPFNRSLYFLKSLLGGEGKRGRIQCLQKKKSMAYIGYELSNPHPVRHTTSNFLIQMGNV
jgi:hypothetical protein